MEPTDRQDVSYPSLDDAAISTEPTAESLPSSAFSPKKSNFLGRLVQELGTVINN
jgi:hypothetical protein